MQAANYMATSARPRFNTLSWSQPSLLCKLVLPQYQNSVQRCDRNLSLTAFRQRLLFTTAASSSSAADTSPPSSSILPGSNFTHLPDNQDEAFWTRRIMQKHRYAQETLNLAREGGPRGPDLIEYIRKRMLFLAEGEILEESWFSLGTNYAWPAASRMAASCYHQAILHLQQRHERFACAILLEDWIRFASWQNVISSQDVVDEECAQSIVTLAAEYALQERPGTYGSQVDWLLSLDRLLEASEAADLSWSNLMCRRAGCAFYASGNMERGNFFLNKALQAWWKRGQSARIVPESCVISLSQQRQRRDASFSKTVHTLIREAGKALARLRARTIVTIQQCKLPRVHSQHTSRLDEPADELLRRYLETSVDLARLFEQALLPLPPSPQKSSERASDSQDYALGRLVRELFHHLPEAERLDRLHLDKVRDQRPLIQKVKRLLNITLCGLFWPTRAPEPSESPVAKRRASSQDARLTVAAYDDLLRYCLRHYTPVYNAFHDAPDDDAAQSAMPDRKSLVTAIVAKLSRLKRSARAGRRLKGEHLTTLLNEATYQRLSQVQNSVLNLMLREGRLEPSARSAKHPTVVSDIDVWYLLKDSRNRYQLRRSYVLLRYIAASGRLAKHSPIPKKDSRAFESDQKISAAARKSSAQPLHASRIVRLFVGRSLRHREAVGQMAVGQMAGSDEVQLLSRPDAYVLRNDTLCTALLNIATKSGNWRVTEHLWSLISAFARASKTMVVGSPQHHESQGGHRIVSMPEATAYFQSLHSRMDLAVRNLFPAPHAPAEDLSRPLLSSPDASEIAERILNLRSLTQESYEDLLTAWDEDTPSLYAPGHKKFFVPPDERFFSAVLGAAGYTQILRGIHAIYDQFASGIGTVTDRNVSPSKQDALAFFDAAKPSQHEHENFTGATILHANMRSGLDFLDLEPVICSARQLDNQHSGYRHRFRLACSSFFLQVLADMVLVHRIPLPTGVHRFLAGQSIDELNVLDIEPDSFYTGSTMSSVSLIKLILTESQRARKAVSQKTGQEEVDELTTGDVTKQEKMSQVNTEMASFTLRAIRHRAPPRYERRTSRDAIKGASARRARA